MSGTSSFLFQGAPVPPQPTGSDTQSSYPLWLQTLQYNIGNAASNLASQPYSPFPGATVAQPSADTQNSWNMARGQVGNYGGALQAAANFTTNAGTPITSSDINQYMNPYMGDVIGSLQQAANTNLFQNQLPGIQSQFVGSGQAASPQQMQSANNALYQSNQALDQATSGALQSGYQGALTAAQQQKAMEQSAGAQWGQLGALTQQLGAAQTGELAASGQSQDALNQTNINSALNQWTQQQQWPYQNLGYAADVIRGQNIPTNTQTVGLQYAPGQSYTASPLSSFIGTSLGAQALSGGNTGAGTAANLFRKGGPVRSRPTGGALTAYAEAA